MRSDKIILDKEELINLYSELGSLRKIAKKLCVSEKTILRRFKEYNLHYEPARKYSCNYNYFSENDSPTKFYWAGFIGADGNIASDNRHVLTIGLARKDEGHIVKFRDDIKSNHKIRRYFSYLNGNKHYGSSISISSKIIENDLLRFNVVPAKTKIYKFPEFIIEHNYVNSFILGLIDGDGWWRIHDGQVAVGLSGTPDIVLTSLKIIIKECNLEENSGTIEIMDTFARFEICGNHKCMKIAEWLYKNNERYLFRKYNIAMQAKELAMPKSLELDKIELQELYLKHKNLNAIGRELNCNGTTIARYMQKYNLDYIHERTHNEDYFSKENESPAQFYWAGYLSGMSSIRYIFNCKPSLTITNKNREFLDKFKNEINSTAHVINGKTSYSLSIYSDKIIKDLKTEFNIDKNKIYNYSIPEYVKNHKYIRHFIRGRFDGKGCLSIKKQKLIELTGPIDLLNDIKEVLDCNGIKTLAQVRSRKNKNNNRLTYTGHNVDKFLKFIEVSSINATEQSK